MRIAILGLKVSLNKGGECRGGLSEWQVIEYIRVNSFLLIFLFYHMNIANLK